MVSLVSVTKEDWTFKEISTQQYSHGFHQYPARMHPEIARRIIQKYAADSADVVLDPFGGTGTTAKAASNLGRRFVIVEIENRYIKHMILIVIFVLFL